jgi:hypothetical protein
MNKQAGQTRKVAIIYSIISIGFIVAVMTEQSFSGLQLTVESDIWLPLLLLIASIGVIRKTIWGRWFGYLVSIPFVINAPIGTFLGGYMIWHLTKYRHLFKTWL